MKHLLLPLCIVFGILGFSYFKNEFSKYKGEGYSENNSYRHLSESEMKKLIKSANPKSKELVEKLSYYQNLYGRVSSESEFVKVGKEFLPIANQYIKWRHNAKLYPQDSDSPSAKKFNNWLKKFDRINEDAIRNTLNARNRLAEEFNRNKGSGFRKISRV